MVLRVKSKQIELISDVNNGFLHIFGYIPRLVWNSTCEAATALAGCDATATAGAGAGAGAGAPPPPPARPQMELPQTAPMIPMTTTAPITMKISLARSAAQNILSFRALPALLKRFACD